MAFEEASDSSHRWCVSSLLMHSHESCADCAMQNILESQLPPPCTVGFMEGVAKEFEVDWVGTDIGRGARMTAPGVYIDEEGRLFQNHRWVVTLTSHLVAALKLLPDLASHQRIMKKRCRESAVIVDTLSLTTLLHNPLHVFNPRWHFAPFITSVLALYCRHFSEVKVALRYPCPPHPPLPSPPCQHWSLYLIQLLLQCRQYRRQHWHYRDLCLFSSRKTPRVWHPRPALSVSWEQTSSRNCQGDSQSRVPRWTQLLLLLHLHQSCRWGLRSSQPNPCTWLNRVWKILRRKCSLGSLARPAATCTPSPRSTTPIPAMTVHPLARWAPLPWLAAATKAKTKWSRCTQSLCPPWVHERVWTDHHDQHHQGSWGSHRAPTKIEAS